MILLLLNLNYRICQLLVVKTLTKDSKAQVRWGGGDKYKQGQLYWSMTICFGLVT